jgi:hypothetical protein
MGVGAGRFDLNARLIGSKAKQAAAQLCKQLAATLEQAAQHSGSGSSSSSDGTHDSSSSHSDGSSTAGEIGQEGASAMASVVGMPTAAQCLEGLQQLQHVRQKLCIAS